LLLSSPLAVTASKYPSITDPSTFCTVASRLLMATSRSLDAAREAAERPPKSKSRHVNAP
jgi:hypothetical protein